MAWQSSTINPATTTPAADISKITNDLQQLRGVIGGTPDVAIPSVWTTPTNVLAQTANSATTAGTSTAYTLAPAQAITSYAAGQTFWVTFHAASGANPTLQISGVASPPTLVRQAADGTYVNIGVGDIPGNHRSRVTLLSASQALIEDLPPVVASIAGFKNKIINGKMDISERGGSFPAIAANAYCLDRWAIGIGGSTSAVLTASQQTDAPTNNEFLQSLRLAVTTADTSIASTEFVSIRQRVEGYNVRDLIGRTFTLSFWVRSSKTGIHCVSLQNSGGDRSYVAEYTITTANTWEQKTITVSGGLITAGTWNWTAGIGLAVEWTLASGTSFHTTAGAWQTGSFRATANQVNCLDSTSNIFAITGVQLEPGSVATPFEHRSFGAELALCQRYYAGSIGPVTISNQTAAPVVCTGGTSLPVTMRATPTVTGTGATAASANYISVQISTAAFSIVSSGTITASIEL